MLSYSGFFFINAEYCFLETFFGLRIPFHLPLKSKFLSGFNNPDIIFTTRPPIARALVSPSDSIPATSTKYGTSFTSSIINSCLSSCAQFPLKDIMT